MTKREAYGAACHMIQDTGTESILKHLNYLELKAMCYLQEYLCTLIVSIYKPADWLLFEDKRKLHRPFDLSIMSYQTAVFNNYVMQWGEKSTCTHRWG